MGLGFTSILSTITGMLQGFGFGTGYGAGVRFGYEDVYPFFKGNAEQVMQALGFSPVAQSMSRSGFKGATGLNNPMGFQ